jgi:hypothetical protein
MQSANMFQGTIRGGPAEGMELDTKMKNYVSNTSPPMFLMLGNPMLAEDIMAAAYQLHGKEGFRREVDRWKMYANPKLQDIIEEAAKAVEGGYRLQFAPLGREEEKPGPPPSVEGTKEIPTGFDNTNRPFEDGGGLPYGGDSFGPGVTEKQPGYDIDVIEPIPGEGPRKDMKLPFYKEPDNPDMTWRFNTKDVNMPQRWVPDGKLYHFQARWVPGTGWLVGDDKFTEEVAGPGGGPTL